MSTNLIFEEDFDTEDFKAANYVQFTYRNSVFKVKRRTLAQIKADAEEAKENPERETTFEHWFKSNLSPADYERFFELFNDEDNPGRLPTIGKIIAAVEAELAGTGDDEETPKE